MFKEAKYNDLKILAHKLNIDDKTITLAEGYRKLWNKTKRHCFLAKARVALKRAIRAKII